MAEFAYVAYTAQGAQVTGHLSADTAAEAQRRLKAQGLFPSDLAPVTGLLPDHGAAQGRAARPEALGVTLAATPNETKNLTATLTATTANTTTAFGQRASGTSAPHAAKPPPLSDIVAWAERMAALTQGGVDLARALAITTDTPTPGRMEHAARAMLSSLRGGTGLGDAAEASGALDGQAVALLRASDRTGDPASAFRAVADMAGRALSLRRSVQTALSYPAILLVVAVVSVVAMLGGVIPRFESVFDGAAGQVPRSAEVVLALSRGMRAHWPLVLAVLAAPVVLAILALRVRAVNVRLAGLARGLPVLGRILRRLDMAALTGNLGNFLRADVPVLQALALTSAVVPLSGLARHRGAVLDRVQHGEPLSDALVQAAGLPSDIGAMVRAGEESGQVPAMLALVATREQAEAEAAIKRFLAVLEPVMILLIGAIVGGIIFVLFQAILSINDVVL